MNIYGLKVTLVQGPPWIAKENVWRTIEMKGSETLDQLHRAIFKAFDRFEVHLYSFFMSKDRRDVLQEYASPHLFEDDDFPLGGRPRNARHAKLDKLELRPRRKFYYLFDFGDCWEHVVEVLSIEEQEPEGRYPRITERHGESPPQYGEWDPHEEDDWEEEREDDQREPGRVIPLSHEPEST